MSDKTIVYRTFYNPIEANIVRARLEDGGFACFLADENISFIQPLYNQAVGGVKLIVFERDKATIDGFLSEENILENGAHSFPEEKTSGDVEIICEKCGSRNVGLSQATNNRFSWWVTLLSFLLVIYPFKANKCYHCYDCGNEFR
jgi:DNA-directed RNA polymerase subunit RPC12/RpoP